MGFPGECKKGFLEITKSVVTALHSLVSIDDEILGTIFESKCKQVVHSIAAASTTSACN